MEYFASELFCYRMKTGPFCFFVNSDFFSLLYSSL